MKRKNTQKEEKLDIFFFLLAHLPSKNNYEMDSKPKGNDNKKA